MTHPHLEDVSKRFNEKLRESIRDKAWRIVSDMLDSPLSSERGIYPTSKCYDQLIEMTIDFYNQGRESSKVDIVDELEIIVDNAIATALTQERERVVGELEKVLRPKPKGNAFGADCGCSMPSVGGGCGCKVLDFNDALSTAIEIVNKTMS